MDRHRLQLEGRGPENRHILPEMEESLLITGLGVDDERRDEQTSRKHKCRQPGP